MGVIEGFKMGLDLIWSMLTANPMLTAILLVFFGGSVILGLIARVIKNYKLRKSGILEVDEMSGINNHQYPILYISIADCLCSYVINFS